VTATGEATLDVAALRARFPALKRRVGGETAIYLDGPGGSQTPDTVIRAVADYLRDANANCDGPFVTSAATDELIDEARLDDRRLDLAGPELTRVLRRAADRDLIPHVVRPRSLRGGSKPRDRQPRRQRRAKPRWRRG
jgi:hypothetical protein